MKGNLLEPVEHVEKNGGWHNLRDQNHEVVTEKEGAYDYYHIIYRSYNHYIDFKSESLIDFIAFITNNKKCWCENDQSY